MKRNFIKTSLLLAPAIIAASCSSSHGGKEGKMIEKPEISVENGMLSPEVLESFGRITELTPSPDGKYLAYCLTYESIEENKGNSEIYIMETETKETKRLTHTASSESSLQWIEDGSRLAFLSAEGEGKPQICSIKPDGSNRQVHSDVENGVECFLFSPDSKMVVYGSLIKPFDKDTTLFKGLEKTTGRVVNDLMYKHWDQWVSEIPHPFVTNVENGSLKMPKTFLKGNRLNALCCLSEAGNLLHGVPMARNSCTARKNPQERNMHSPPTRIFFSTTWRAERP